MLLQIVRVNAIVAMHIKDKYPSNTLRIKVYGAQFFIMQFHSLILNIIIHYVNNIKLVALKPKFILHTYVNISSIKVFDTDSHRTKGNY